MIIRILSLFYLVFASLFFIICSIISTFISIFRPFGKIMAGVEKYWGKILVLSTGAKVTVRGLEHLKPGKPYIFVANHQSLFDIPLMMGYIPRQIRMIHKKELLWTPFLGWTLMAMRFIAIDRGNRDKAIVSLQRAADKIRKGINIVIYAEGTRSLDGKLQPFKKGAFLLAINAQVDIVPVTISGTINIKHKYGNPLKIGFRRPVVLILSEPVSTEGYTAAHRDELKSHIESIIQSQFASVQDLSVISDPDIPIKVQKKKKKPIHQTSTAES